MGYWTLSRCFNWHSEREDINGFSRKCLSSLDIDPTLKFLLITSCFTCILLSTRRVAFSKNKTPHFDLVLGAGDIFNVLWSWAINLNLYLEKIESSSRRTRWCFYKLQVHSMLALLTRYHLSVYIDYICTNVSSNYTAEVR